MTNTLTSRFLDAAVALLAEGNEEERAAAVSALSALGDETHISVLLNTLRHDDSRKIQHKASQALVRIGGERAVQGLQDLMRADNQYTRFLAAEALADIIAHGRTKQNDKS